MGTQSKADEERTPEEQVQASSKPDVSPLDMSDKIQNISKDCYSENTSVVFKTVFRTFSFPY